jgi:hypothetical protein
MFFPKPSKTETPSWTLSGSTWDDPIHHRESQPDIVRLPLDFVWTLNLDPTTRFLRAVYKHLLLQRLSPLGFQNFLLKEFILSILRASIHSPIELSLQILV